MFSLINKKGSSQNNLKTATMTNIESPTVFISYSWDDNAHCKWVNKLACILINNGIDVLLDQINVFPGSNLENYMIQGLSNSRWVICIISEKYLYRMNDLTTGVGKEIEIIRNNLKTEFVIPIIKNNEKKQIPKLFEGKYFIDFNDFEYNPKITELKITNLVERLFGFEKAIRPIRGTNPFSKELTNERVIEAEIAKTTYINPAFEGFAKFDYSNNSGNYKIGTGEYEFTTHWSKASNQSIHAYNDGLGNGKIALVRKLVDIDLFKESQGLDFTSRTRTPEKGDGIVWINNYGNMAITIIIDIKDCTRGDECDELYFKYKIFPKPI